MCVCVCVGVYVCSVWVVRVCIMYCACMFPDDTDIFAWVFVCKKSGTKFIVSKNDKKDKCTTPPLSFILLLPLSPVIAFLSTYSCLSLSNTLSKKKKKKILPAILQYERTDRFLLNFIVDFTFRCEKWILALDESAGLQWSEREGVGGGRLKKVRGEWLGG